MSDKGVLVENDRWGEFNCIVDNLNLDIKEKGLLLILFRFVNHRTGYADPSRALIKKLTNITDNRTLDKLMNNLIDKELLKRESEKGKRSKYFIKVGGEITPSVKNEPSGEITPLVGGEITPTVGVKITPQKENKKKIKENIYSATENKDSEAYVDEINKSLKDDLLSKIKKEFPKDLIKIELEKLKDKHTNELDLLKELENNLKASKKELNKKPKSKPKEKIYMNLAFIDDVIDKVKITKEQYEKLINKFNKELVHNQILQLDNYIINGKGKKYKDHYRVLNTWCNKNNKDFKPKEITISDEDIEY